MEHTHLCPLKMLGPDCRDRVLLSAIYQEQSLFFSKSRMMNQNSSDRMKFCGSNVTDHLLWFINVLLLPHKVWI